MFVKRRKTSLIFHSSRSMFVLNNPPRSQDFRMKIWRKGFVILRDSLVCKEISNATFFVHNIVLSKKMREFKSFNALRLPRIPIPVTAVQPMVHQPAKSYDVCWTPCGRPTSQWNFRLRFRSLPNFPRAISLFRCQHLLNNEYKRKA